MSHWNYRVMLKDDQVAVHEVFYRDDGSIRSCTVDPVFPRAETIEDLVAEFEQYRQALSEPVLDFAALDAEYEKPRIDGV